MGAGGEMGFAFSGNSEMVRARKRTLHSPLPAASWTSKRALLCLLSSESGKSPQGILEGLGTWRSRSPAGGKGDGIRVGCPCVERLVKGRAWFVPVSPVLHEKSRVRPDHGVGGEGGARWGPPGGGDCSVLASKIENIS